MTYLHIDERQPSFPYTAIGRLQFPTPTRLVHVKCSTTSTMIDVYRHPVEVAPTHEGSFISLFPQDNFSYKSESALFTVYTTPFLTTVSYISFEDPNLSFQENLKRLCYHVPVFEHEGLVYGAMQHVNWWMVIP